MRRANEESEQIKNVDSRHHKGGCSITKRKDTMPKRQQWWKATEQTKGCEGEKGSCEYKCEKPQRTNSQLLE